MDLALFCGDAYRSRDPSQTHQREFARRIVRLSEAGIPSFLLIGNHDTPHVQGRATALEIYRTLAQPRVTIGDSAKTYRIETPSGLVQIVAVPWVRRSQFMAREDMRRLSAEEVTDRIQQTLTALIRSQVDALDPEVPAILAGHATVNEAVTSSEQSMMLGTDHVLLRSAVALDCFEYVALGHIHRHQVLGRNPHVVYSGSLQRIDFGEERDEKGFCLVDIDTKAPRGERMTDFEFRRVNARRFHTINVKLRPDDTDPNESVTNEIARHDITDAIVRLNIELPSSAELLLSNNLIRAALSDAHYVANISRNITEQTRTRLDGASAEGLGPSELLSRYLESREIPPDRAKELMKRAQELISEQNSN